jgi:virginiamycin B lyase
LGRKNIPWAITVGADAAIWFTEWFIGKIGRITTNGTITQFPQTVDVPLGIAAGPDGALWFTEEGADKIGRITTTGTLTEYPIPTPNGQPYGIVLGPDGAMWFTVPTIGVSYIGRITTGGVITEYPIPGGINDPEGIVVGPDAALWFTNGPSIGRITTAGVITELPTPGCDSFVIDGIAADPETKSIWYTDVGINAIGRIAHGKIIDYAVPTPTSALGQIVAGRNALWFTEGVGKIGRITKTGKITEFTIPTPGSEPHGITINRRSVWFTEAGSDKIGRLSFGLSRQ